MRHYTWNGSGGVSSNEKSIEGYKDVATGEFIPFGNGENPKDYDLAIPGYGGSTFGASEKRIANSNNSFALDQERGTGGSLGIEEGRQSVRRPIGERVANLVPSVSSRMA